MRTCVDTKLLAKAQREGDASPPEELNVPWLEARS
jgi:hypothetical protein